MLKKIALGYSIVYMIIFLIFMGEIIFNNGQSSLYSLFGYGSSSIFADGSFMLEFVRANTFGLITVVISSLMLHKSNDSIFPKIAIWIAVVNVPIFLINYGLTQNANSLSSFSKLYLVPVINFLNSGITLSYIYVISALLTIAILPENAISEKIRKINIIVIVINLLIGIAILILPNTISKRASYDVLASTLNNLVILLKIYIVTLGFDFVLICMGHILNYVFAVNSDPEKEKIVEDLDYDELARLARENVKAKEQELYNIQINKNTDSAANNQANVAQPSAPQPVVNATPEKIEREQLSIPVQSQPVKAPTQEDLQIPVQAQAVPTQSAQVVPTAPQETQVTNGGN